MSGLAYLQERASANPEEEAHFTKLADLFKDRLWYQLTQKLLELLTIPFFQQKPELVKLYNEFVKGFQKELNQLDLAKFAIAAAKQEEDFKGAMEFLDKVAESVKGNPEAETLCKVERVYRMVENKETKKASKLLEETKKDIDSFDGIMDPVVHSAYYKSIFVFNKAKDNATEIFKNALLYLSYTPVEKVPENERMDFARDVSMAALAGKDIFNFGELLERPVVKVLAEGKYSWTLKMLEAFNKGDIKAFDQIYSDQKAFEPQLVQNHEFLSMKVRIMRLMVAVFNRPSQERAITFKEISGFCECKLDQVEFVIMKAFSLGVLKGTIDQVSQIVTVNWVKPRVLSIDQVKGMSKRLKVWAEEVEKATKEVEESSKEILQH